jgi:hypothetical protein
MPSLNKKLVTFLYLFFSHGVLDATKDEVILFLAKGGLSSKDG